MHRSGEIADVANMALVFGSLGSTFEQFGRHGAAATLCGVVHGYSQRALGMADELPLRLRAHLGDPEFGDRVALGSAMELAEAVRYVPPNWSTHGTTSPVPELIAPGHAGRTSP